MDVFYCDHHEIPLPAGHRFPIEKYARLRSRLLEEGLVERGDLHPSEPAPMSAVLAVHRRSYVDAFVSGALERRAAARIGFPWSPSLVRRTLASAGGTLAACRSALRDGVAANLAGGTHHAHADFGAGYCVFNDLAIAARDLLSTERVRRVLIVDLDVHQGDGTAALLRGEERAFTLSVHGARNFPLRKQESDLDVALPDGAGDADYLEAVERALDEALARSRPELILYQAGVDALAEDRLGRLELSLDGLLARDRLVLGRTRDRGLPLVLTLGGGYAEPIDRSIEAHLGTYRALAELRAGGFAPSRVGPGPPRP